MATDIKETMAIIGRKIMENVDRSAFVAFLLLLLLMAGIYGLEVSRPEPEIVYPEGGTIPRALPNDDYKKALAYARASADIDQDENLRAIRDFNIFDFKKVRDREEMEKAADKKYERAAQLSEQGNNDEAEKMLKEILQTWPSHLRSRELLKKIEASRATPTPTPTPAPRRPEGPPGESIPGEPGEVGLF